MSRPVIGITLGDPAGIGPEVTRAALESGGVPAGYRYEVIGEAPAGTTPGMPDTRGARAALASLEEGCRLARDGRIAALVTAPVSKAALHGVGFRFPGQTEFLAERCGVTDFAMALTGGGLTVGLVTIHIPLADVSGRLSAGEVARVGRLLVAFLRDGLGLARARLAVAGLNPHAGEGGSIGTEEAAVIEPAVRVLAAECGEAVAVTGPHPPDTVFHRALEGAYDAVLCMYHDQGLIPLKLHAFHSGVNTTLGLPIIRTSPDHGTAFDLAGRGTARADSMIEAIRLAVRLVENRAGGVRGIAD